MKKFLSFFIYLFLCQFVMAQDFVGTMEGAFSVSPTGAATYTIPIQIKDGYSDFSPQISLTYNSQTGNGIAGYGWSISGLSSITAIPHTVYFDSIASGISTNTSDVYALDGQRLLLESGMNGKKNAQYVTEEETFNKIYIDSAFASTPKSFVVKRPDGTTLRYGSTPNAIYRYPDSSGTKAFCWLLDYMEDKDGNYINYSYTYYDNTPYLTQIQYGTNKHAGTGNCHITFHYENRPDTITSYLNGYQFLTKKRLSKIYCYYYSNKIHKRYVLAYSNSSFYSHLISVEEKGGTGNGYPSTTFTWEELPSIQMERDDASVPDIIGTTYDEFCYFSGDVDNDGKAELLCLHPSGISSSNIMVCKPTEGGNWSVHNSYNLSSSFDDTILGISNTLNGGIIAHFRNSQENSIVIPSLFKNSSNQYIAHFEMPKDGVSCNQRLSHTTQMPAYAIADFDKDGIDEIVTIEKKQLVNKKIYLTTLHIDLQQTTLEQTNNQGVAIPTLTSTQCNDEVQDCLVSDFDGDGLFDLLVICNNFSILLWNERGNINGTNYTILSSIRHSDTMQIADFNADGLPDLIINETSSTIWKKALNNGTRSSSLFSTSNIAALNTLNIKKQNSDDNEYFCLVQDMNADGLSDMVIGYNNSNTHKVCWVQANRDDSLSIINQHNTPSSTYKYHLVVGDFYGDGCPEILNYGSNLLTEGSSSERVWHTYSNEAFSPSNNKITAITDGLGKRTSIYYRSLLDRYSNNKQVTFPLMKFYAPLTVVDNSVTSWGNTGYQTDYHYTNGIFHAQGKGFLGFMETSQTANGLTTLVSHDINTTYFVPHLIQQRTTDSTGNLAYQHIYQYSYEYSNVPKSYVKHLVSEDEKDVVGNKETFVSYSNFHYSAPCTITSGEDIHTTTTTTYTDLIDGDMWMLCLPTSVEIENETEDYNGNTDTFCKRMLYTYDNNGRLTKRQSYRGNTFSSCHHTQTELFQYNSGGKNFKTKTIAYNSTDTLTTFNAYDSHGRITKRTYADEHSIRYSYNTLGELTSEQDLWFNTKNQFTYNKMGQLTQKVRKSTTNAFIPDTVVISYELSSLPQYSYQITATSKYKPTSIQYYDGFGRNAASGTIHFDGREFISCRNYITPTTIGFESVPHLKGTSTDIGTTYTYDSFFRPIEIIDPEGKTTEYSYSNGYKTITENGITTEYLYNDDGRLTNRYDDKGDIDYYYKATGEYDRILLGYLEGNDVFATYTYDGYGRLQQLQTPNGDVRSYQYTSNGFLRAYRIGNSIEYYTYNKFGDCIRKSYTPQSTQVTATYTYDDKRQLTSVNGSNYSESYTYNSSGQLTNKQRSVTVENQTYTKSSSYLYNGESQIQSITSILDGIAFPIVERYEYNRGWRNNIHLNNRLAWQLESEDAQGRTSATSNRLGTSTFTYNQRGQITSSNSSVYAPTPIGTQSISHNNSYDAYGRISSKDGKNFSYDDYNQLTAWNNQSYSYDARGNIAVDGAQGGITYNGYKLRNVTSPVQSVWGDFGLSFIYNSSQRPYRINFSRGNTVWGHTCLDYDANGNRISMIKNDYLVPETVVNGELIPPEEENDFIRAYVDEQYEVEYWLPPYNYPSVGVPTHFYYVGGDPISACAVAIIQNDQLKLSQIYRDDQGSITAMADSTTVERYYYTPWGRYCDASGSTSQNTYGKGGHPYPFFYRGFLGQEYICDYGIYNLNARFYDPFIGRFLSPDPVLDASGSLFGFNPYIYGNNCPSMYMDPDGEFPWLIVAAAAIGGAVNLYMNRDKVKNFWQGLGFFSVGAVTGAASAYTGGMASGVFQGIAIGSTTGGLFSGITGGGNSKIAGGSFSDGFWESCFSGMICGGITGGIFGGLSAAQQGRNIWTGKTINNTNSIRAERILNHWDKIIPEEETPIDVPDYYRELTSHQKGDFGVNTAMTSYGLNESNSATEISYMVGNKVYRSDITTIGPDGVLDIYEIKMGVKAGFTHNQKYTLPMMFKGEPIIPFGGNAWKATQRFGDLIVPGVPIHNYRIHVIHYTPAPQ